MKAILCLSTVVLLLGLAGAPAKADRGGQIPVPFGGINQKVELADGEQYFLVGTIVDLQADDGTIQSFLKVDLEDHPWLATAHRLAFPYYPILGADSSQYWRSLNGKSVRMWVKAVGLIQQGVQGPRYVMALQLIQAFY